MTDFGASFIKARKSAGLSLAQIAVETRISTRFLKAIEDEEFHLLPGGVFNRGFVRAYADRIGLDPEKAVADYERVTASRQPSEPLETTASLSSQPKVPWLSYPVVLGVLLLVLIIFYMVARDSVNTALPAIEPQVSISQPLAEPALPEPGPLSEARSRQAGRLTGDQCRPLPHWPGRARSSLWPQWPMRRLALSNAPFEAHDDNVE